MSVTADGPPGRPRNNEPRRRRARRRVLLAALAGSVVLGVLAAFSGRVAVGAGVALTACMAALAFHQALAGAGDRDGT